MQAIVGATARAGEAEALAHRRVIEEEVQRTLFWQPWRTASIDAGSLANLQSALVERPRAAAQRLPHGPVHLHVSALGVRGVHTYAVSAPWFFEPPSHDYWGRRLARWWHRLEHQRKNRARGLLTRLDPRAQRPAAGGRARADLLRHARQARDAIPRQARDARRRERAPGRSRPARRSCRCARSAWRAGARTEVGEALDPRDYGDAEELHDALAAVHERWILEQPEAMEDPNRPGAWEGGASELEWIRAGRVSPAAHPGPRCAQLAAELDARPVLQRGQPRQPHHRAGPARAGAARGAARQAEQVEARFAGPAARWDRSPARAAARRAAPLAGCRPGLPRRCAGTSCSRCARARALARELAQWPADVVHVHSHSIALRRRARLRTLPVALSVDATVRDWSAMPAWRLSARARGSSRSRPSGALERRALRTAALVLAWTGWARAASNARRRGRTSSSTTRASTSSATVRRRAASADASAGAVRGRALRGEGRRGPARGARRASSARRRARPRHARRRVRRARGVRVHRLGPSDPQLLELQQQADCSACPPTGTRTRGRCSRRWPAARRCSPRASAAIPELLDGGRAGALIDARRPARAARGAADAAGRRTGARAAGRARPASAASATTTRDARCRCWSSAARA